MESWFLLSCTVRPWMTSSEIKIEREPLMDLAEKLPVEGGGDDIQRKELHEVHSGPNPISNSTPQQWWKTKLERKP
ncbi:hypothetical protein AAG906_016463 [Vitis piasezkii]